MHIIFGKEPAQLLASTHTVLELDTFHITDLDTVVTAYCVVESVPFEEMIKVDSLRQDHNDMIVAYQNQKWSTTLELIDQLKGCWGGELDSFYDELQHRVQGYVETAPPADWTPVIQK